MAARSSSDFACWRRDIERDRSKQASAWCSSGTVWRRNNSPLSRYSSASHQRSPFLSTKASTSASTPNPSSTWPISRYGVGSNKGTQNCIAFWRTLPNQEVTKFLDLQHLYQMCRKWRSKGKRNGLIFLPLQLPVQLCVPLLRFTRIWPAGQDAL